MDGSFATGAGARGINPGVEIMANAGSNDSVPSTTANPARATRRILIAEDDQEMASLLEGALQKAGYETVLCHDGWELLQHLKFSKSDKSFEDIDLVVSDIRMPRISGLDVLRTQSFGGEFPPIILITAFGDEWTRGKARYLGAVDMFDKPFEIGKLVDRVKELIPQGP